MRVPLVCGHTRTAPSPAEGARRRAYLCPKCRAIVPAAVGACRCGHAAAGHERNTGPCKFPACGCEQWRPRLEVLSSAPDTPYYRNPEVHTSLVSQDVEGVLFTIGSDYDHIKIIAGPCELTFTPDQLTDEIVPAFLMALFTAAESHVSIHKEGQ